LGLHDLSALAYHHKNTICESVNFTGSEAKCYEILDTKVAGS
jgi:hypothetical protein